MVRTFALTFSAAAILAVAFSSAGATGLATCDSGAKAGWKPESALREELTKKGWNIRRIKEDGGCYEVYAIDDKGRRVESYFHPVTFAHVHTSAR